MAGVVVDALLSLNYRGGATWIGELSSVSEEVQSKHGSMAIDLGLEQFAEEKEDAALDKEFATVAGTLLRAEVPEDWSQNPKLFCLLHKIHCGDLLDQFLEASVTDLWLPLPRRTVRKFLKNDEDVKMFMAIQTAWFDVPLPISLEGQHLALSDPDNLKLDEIKFLGAGGYGEVHSVKHLGTGQIYAMKSMSRPIVHKHHVDIMTNFKREINGMRRAQHQHCIALKASFTDAESIRLLCAPVADMDLSVLLDLDSLDGGAESVLRHAIGCITSALAYLHDLNIRHDDLKPNNILIHGENVLLTDFGFCLDTTDSEISTTTGPPAHFSRRYSAPEVTSHAPRSRLTDIWSLGCVLFDIMSRLCGHRLSTMNAFWLENGIRYNSYADNREATRIWYESIVADRDVTRDLHRHRKVHMISFIYHIILEPERLLRPTAQQILDKWKDADFLYLLPSSGIVGRCCFGQTAYTPSSAGRPAFTRLHGRTDRMLYIFTPRWPGMDLLCWDDHFAYLFLDLNLKVLGRSENLHYLYEPSNLNPTLSSIEFIHYPEFESKLNQDIIDMFRSTGIANPPADQRDLTAISSSELVKSLYLSYPNETSTRAYNLLLRLSELSPEGNRAVDWYTVLFTLSTVQLERRESHGRPFIVMIFNPQHPETLWL